MQNRELKSLKAAHEQVVEEVEFLRAKNEVFEQSDKHVEFLNEKIRNLQLEIERQAEELRDCDFQIRNCKAENTVLKEDLLNGDSSLAAAREDLRKVSEAKARLEGQVLKLSAKGEEDTMKIEELEGKQKELMASLLRRGVENQDLKAQLHQARRKSGNKDDIIQDLEAKNSAQEQSIIVLKKKLEQRTESENILRRKHEKLHAEHDEVTKLAEKRLNDGQLAENKFNEKLNKLEGELLSTKSNLQRTKAANQVTLKAFEEEKGKLKTSL